MHLDADAPVRLKGFKLLYSSGGLLKMQSPKSFCFYFVDGCLADSQLYDKMTQRNHSGKFCQTFYQYNLKKDKNNWFPKQSLLIDTNRLVNRYRLLSAVDNNR